MFMLFSILATDDLVMEGAMASADMEFTKQYFLLEYSSHYDNFSILDRI